MSGRGLGPDRAGHDPGVVPPLRAAEVEIHRDRDQPDQARIVYSFKVEQGHPPYPVLHVARNWMATVAHRDHVLLDGRPVLGVLDHDAHGRPARILTAVISGGFDPVLHGWRAHAETHLGEVVWDDDTAAVHLRGWVAG